MSWVFKWRVDIEYRRASDSPRGWGRQWYGYVHTVADLRTLILAARADDGVLSYRYRRDQVLDKGDKFPTRCPDKHSLAPGPVLYSPWKYSECGCRGHWRATCPICARVLVVPALQPGCERYARDG